MTTHVFVVDINTFPLHLEYLFAGTGAKEDTVDFNAKKNSALTPAKENKLAAMIADASRIRAGDKVLFYLQQNAAQGVREGKFYGVFEAALDWSFLDNNDLNQFLRTELQKSLTFRTLLKPFQVYPQGVTEWEALDEIRNIHSPNQMLWSLIYRKLKGNRGNTMITQYESDRLMQLIRNKNKRATLTLKGGEALSFNGGREEIFVKEDGSRAAYKGRVEELDLLPRLLSKCMAGRAFEAHLQAHIVKIIGTGIDRDLDQLLVGEKELEWLGNEVSVGVGMQRIDIALSLLSGGQRIIEPIELKAVEADYLDVKQIERYVDWIEQYYVPNLHSDIQPVLVTKKGPNKQKQKRVRDAILSFDEKNEHRCLPIRHIEFECLDTGLQFFEVDSSVSDSN